MHTHTYADRLTDRQTDTRTRMHRQTLIELILQADHKQTLILQADPMH